MTDDVGGEVHYFFKRASSYVQQQAHGAGHALQVPDVRDRHRQVNVAHALPSHLRPGYFNSTAVTGYAAELYLPVFPTVTLPIPGGAEDALTEEPIRLRLESPVVDRLGLLHFSMREPLDLIRRGEPNTQLVEIGGVYHALPPLPLRAVAALTATFRFITSAYRSTAGSSSGSSRLIGWDSFDSTESCSPRL